MSFTLWFMGRPAAGKSTIAKLVENYLREEGFQVENLDGDEVRQNLHPDLGFTRKDRALNNRRTAYLCRLLNRNGISVVTGMITPFRDAQRKSREIVEDEGTFVLVYVKCSLEECKRRDPKGLYKRAEAGKIRNFTGVDHPFEEPHNPDVVVNAEGNSVDECVTHVLSHLRERGLLDEEPDKEYSFDITRREEAKIMHHLRDKGHLNEDT